MFDDDLNKNEKLLSNEIKNSKFLVIGGAGSIGQSVVLEIFKRSPKLLHVIDINENNLTELVRDIRSSIGYIAGDFKTFAIDNNSIEFEALMYKEKYYDYIFNLSALKHVRSEKDPFTLMRMLEVNVLNTLKTLDLVKNSKIKKYFSVSTDKAVTPINLMGASKRIMELCLFEKSKEVSVSTARFANVAFSDGSILDSFRNRVFKKQPIALPKDIKRYFISPLEGGQLCLLSAILGNNREIFFPKLNSDQHLIKIQYLCEAFLNSQGFEPFYCKTENEARKLVSFLPSENKWPILLTTSDTSGEKSYEEFYSNDEDIDLNLFNKIGVIKNEIKTSSNLSEKITRSLNKIKKKKKWDKKDFIDLFNESLENFSHKETGKSLDLKM